MWSKGVLVLWTSFLAPCLGLDGLLHPRNLEHSLSTSKGRLIIVPPPLRLQVVPL
jgi:hypothetical protein